MGDVHAKYSQDFPRMLMCLISSCKCPQKVCRCQVTLVFFAQQNSKPSYVELASWKLICALSISSLGIFGPTSC